LYLPESPRIFFQIYDGKQIFKVKQFYSTNQNMLKVSLIKRSKNKGHYSFEFVDINKNIKN